MRATARKHRYISYIARVSRLIDALFFSEKCQKADWKLHKKTCEMQQVLNRYNDQPRTQPRPDPKRCTGCSVKFNRDYPCEDECESCGYVACESCACDHSNGEFREAFPCLPLVD